MTERQVDAEAEVQTDANMDKPADPLFIPAKVGLDQCTQIQDGDLWSTFQKAVKAKGAKWVKLKEVKGHATDEMVGAGKVEMHENIGSDKSDTTVDKGATKEDERLNDLADLYSHRQR